MHIPGVSDLLDKGDMPQSLILITGPSGSGKTVYCRQFFAEGLFDGEYCIYVSSSLTNKQFRNQFSNIEKLNLDKSSTFINPYLYNKPADSQQQHLSSQSVSISSIDTYQKSTNTDQ